MDEAEITTSNFMPRDLIEIICILERGEKCHSYKITQKRNYFTLVTKGFPAKNGESTPLKNNASGQPVLLTNIRIRKLKILPM